MVQFLRVIVLIFTVALLIGCPGASQRYFKGVRYEFPANERITRAHQSEAEDTFEFKSLTLHVLVERDVLTVNGQRYGMVTRGDRVEVTTKGKVFVNDEQRSPEPKP